jgi:hypothetical protein
MQLPNPGLVNWPVLALNETSRRLLQHHLSLEHGKVKHLDTEKQGIKIKIKTAKRSPAMPFHKG